MFLAATRVVKSMGTVWIDVESLRKRLGDNEEFGELIYEDDVMRVYIIVRKKNDEEIER